MSQTTERFELETRIAVGNAALVYRGVEKETRRRVALKLLNEQLAHPLDGEALIRDAARLRRMAGNNIAQLLDAHEGEAGVVLVYEFADGVSWTDAVGQNRPTAEQALDLAAQLLSALAVGEAIKMPHGELKPANLVLGELPGGRLFVWVLDWGLSAYRNETPPDALPWMAPERLAGGEASAAADIFSMGACLCWLLTGKLPVPGCTREHLLAAWERFPADGLRFERPDLPPKFTRWVSDLMKVNPKLRFDTVAAARAALMPLKPPAAPVLPEIFRARPKSPQSNVTASARSGMAPPLSIIAPAARPPASTAGMAVPVRKPPAAPTSRPVLVVETKSHWPWIWAVTLVVLTGFVVALPFSHRRLATTAAGRAQTGVQTAAAEPAPAQTRDPLPAAARTVIAEERFSYAAGAPLQGQNGGTGWTSPWNAPLATVGAGSLSGGQPKADGIGGHVSLVSADEVTLSRALGLRAAFIDESKGGTWWLSIVIAHSVPRRGSGGELQCNFFAAGALDDIVCLMFSVKGRSLSVSSVPASSSATLPGAADIPKRVLVRVKAAPVSPGKFDVTLDLWANPDPATFSEQPPEPLLSAKSQNVAIPAHLGVTFQKKKARSPTTTLLDEIRFGRKAKEVLD